MNCFKELQKICPGLLSPGVEAENNVEENPRLALEMLEKVGENLIRALLAVEGLNEPVDQKHITRLNILNNRGFLPPIVRPFFHCLRNIHRIELPPQILQKQSKICLQLAMRLSVWFTKSYGPYLPKIIFSRTDVDNIVNDLKQNPPSDSERRSARQSAARRAATMKLSEDETRVIIDFQLRAAGWQADTWGVRYAQGDRPVKGSNKAIAEWPTETGPADYALFSGHEFIGVIEAKKMGKDVVADLEQSKRYARDAELKGDAKFPGGPWGEYRVPFLFSTNARPYLEQLKEKSGIWFLDVRSETNHPKPLQGWYSAKELDALLQQNIAEAHEKLANESMEYLGLRDYQKYAVRAIEAAIDEGSQKLLVAMATGTGKTRLAIGLIYRLIKSKRFRRVLFVVDRNSLGQQAGDKFKEMRLEELKTFDQIYDIKEIDKSKIEPTTKVNIATVQGLMRTIMSPSDNQDAPTVGEYDCIVVDEAHRGYTLDRELGEDELLFRNQNEYLSKYRWIINYFDAVKIGLTATPAPHTIDIFGGPVFTYTYREAVVDGWLIDHEPPHQIVTRLAKDGIKWEKGETIPVYDPATGQISNIENIPDEVEIEVDHFNKLVVTENFNRTVAKELVKHLNPDGDEKTLIFAATDDHADMVARTLKEEFENSGVPISDEAIAKITGSIDKPDTMIRQFKNEKLPNIAVTVDLLTTGIDVPEICNLVFIRRVRSRILFEQMLGRATRRCDRIKKAHFNIYDAVAIYEALEPVTNMKAVAANPSTTLSQLVDELEDMASEQASPEKEKAQVEQILAKFQRSMRRLEDNDLADWHTLSGGESLQSFIDRIDVNDPVKTRQTLTGSRKLLAFLDENRHRPKQQLISHHDDDLYSHTRGYGNAEKPEDYLNAFREFVIMNINKIPALAIVCQRPRALTRQALRELKLELDRAGFNENKLRIAWKDWKNEDIAADIISFIRREALGDPLISHEERIKKAMSRIYAMKEWTAVQRQWLERIEKQLLAQTILDREDFDKGAFADYGGFKRLNKIFQGNFQQVLDDINTELYSDQKDSA